MGKYKDEVVSSMGGYPDDELEYMKQEKADFNPPIKDYPKQEEPAEEITEEV